MDPTSLHTLMDAAVDGQRKDIYDYTFGHLNYARCGKTTSDDEPKLHWSASVRKKTPQGNPLRVKTEEVNKMTEALFDFSSGTTGAISNQTSNVLQEATSSVTIPPPPQEQLEKNLLEEMQRLIWKNSDSNLLSSPKYEDQSPRGIPKKVLPSIERSKKIVCEELKLPEIMLPVMDDSANIPPSMQVAASKQFEKKRFVTTYHAGVSLKDQFQKMMDFDRNVLKKPDTIERKVGDGHKAVEHLERKLIDRLLGFQTKNIRGPSFERLQLYSEIWDDLSADSSIFGELLVEIKQEYDAYLVHLLDTGQSTNRAELARCLELIQGMSSVEKVDTSQDLRGDVEVLEIKCRDALLRNREIRMKMRSEMRRIEEERRMQEEEDEENIRRMLPVRRNRNKSPLKSRGGGSTRNSKLSTGQRLRVLHSNIWERLGKLEELRTQLKSCHIPKQTHRNVQHAVKDTELEIQKLQQQIEYLLQSKQTHLGKLDSHLKRSNISVETLMSIHDIIEKKTNPQQDDPV